MPQIEGGTVCETQCGLICLAATPACSSVQLAWEYALCTSVMVVHWDNIWKVCVCASKFVGLRMIQYVNTD